MASIKERKYKRLREANGLARDDMKTARQTRRDIIKQMVGTHYSTKGADDKVAVNMLALTLNIYLSQLVPRGPQSSVTSNYSELRPYTYQYQLAINQALLELEYEHWLRSVVQDALVGPMGILKIAQGDGGSINGSDYGLEDRTYQLARQYCKTIDFDDWSHDMSVTDIRDVSFMTHKFRIPLEKGKANKNYDAKVRNELTATHKLIYDDSGTERLSSISKDVGRDTDEYQDYVELQEFWLPDERLLLVAPCAETKYDRPLQTIEWDGPETGPYHLLYFNTVPDQTMPLSPIMQLLDLHDLINRVFRKAARQAERQKTVPAARKADEADAKVICDTGDGEFALTTNDPSNIKEFKFGGVEPTTMVLLDSLLQRFDYMAGNLSSIGGLGAAAETLGQEQIIKQSASGVIKELQHSVQRFSKKNMQAIAFYEWHELIRERRLNQKIENSNMEIEHDWSQENRKGKYNQYDYDITPYSMQDYTPLQRMQIIDQLFTNIVIPLAPVLAQSGIVPNFQLLFKLKSEYLNMPEIKDLLSMSDRQMETGESSAPQDMTPRQSPVTSRTYDRVSRSTDTGQNMNNSILQSIMGQSIRNTGGNGKGA